LVGGSCGLGTAIAKRLAQDRAAAALTYSASPARTDEIVRAIEAARGSARDVSKQRGEHVMPPVPVTLVEGVFSTEQKHEIAAALIDVTVLVPHIEVPDRRCDRRDRLFAPRRKQE